MCCYRTTSFWTKIEGIMRYGTEVDTPAAVMEEDDGDANKPGEHAHEDLLFKIRGHAGN